VNIRPATLKDIPLVVQLVSKYTDHFPVRKDNSKIKRLLVEAISTKSNFCWVSTEDNIVTGAIVAISQHGLWFERRHTHILFFATSTRGAGQSMLREFMRWVTTRKAIKVVSVDFVVPPRMGNLLTRVGLPSHSSSHILFK